MAETIIIGDTLERTVYFYEPLASNPTKPDYTKPIDWAGYAVTFNIKNGSTLKTYSGGKVVLTTLDGETKLSVVKIALTPEDTDALKVSSENILSSSYLEFKHTATGREYTRARRDEIIRAKAKK
jgi:hypothetical protein